MKNSTPYMYLFIREDLSTAQQIVQTAHAVEQLQGYGESDITNHMVLIGAKDQDDLTSIADYLTGANINHAMFYEPDIESYTAIATWPLIGLQRKPMKHFQLKQ